MNPDENEENDNTPSGQSQIPEPDTSRDDAAESSDGDGEVSEEQMVLDDLKNRATTMGISFHPSIGVEKLRKKIQQALDDNATQAPTSQGGTEPANEDLAAKKNDMMKLVRVRISNMDPMKKNHQGDFFLTGNALVGTVKRYVPFNVPWHVPQIILNMIQEKEFQQFSSSKNAKNIDVTTSKLVKTYGVEILDPLTEQELKELGQRQAMAKGAESA